MSASYAGAVRRHRWVTVPWGLVLFACVGLPGYRSCGRNVAMFADPYLAACCITGLAVAIAAVAFARRRGEREVAVVAIVLPALAACLLGLGILAAGPVYVGVTLGFAAAVATTAGAVLWAREARGKSIDRAVELVGVI